MAEHNQVKLRLVGPPSIGRVITAPPTLNASDHTVEYLCGHCDAVLLHAEEDQVHSLTIHCTKCGSYNRTDE